jgi:hypothetical protein
MAERDRQLVDGHAQGKPKGSGQRPVHQAAGFSLGFLLLAIRIVRIVKERLKVSLA